MWVTRKYEYVYQIKKVYCMIKIKTTNISGCLEIFPEIFNDERGFFIKTFHQDIFLQHGLNVHYPEEFYTVSYYGVLRGLHFQLPPFEHFKMVHCVLGEVLDVVVDIRIGSSTYGQFQTFHLSAEKRNIIYIPPGLAHGFLVLSDYAILLYKISTMYSQQHDSGILWNSLDIPWGISNPIISKRDSQLLPFSQFISPFKFME